MQNITLSLTIDETSALINILGNLPNSANVFELYQNILKQAREQAQLLNSPFKKDEQ